MSIKRIIAMLLVENGKLIKTTKFRNPNYIGDPFNAVRILNEKCCDELVLVDRTLGRGIDFATIEAIASECFMPLTYVGGVKSAEDAKKLVAIGVEKIGVNSAAIENPAIVSEIANITGRSSVVGFVDVAKHWLRRDRCVYRWRKNECLRMPALKDHLEKLIDRGVGELVVTDVSREGTFAGFDLDLVRELSQIGKVPMLFCGGASSVENMYEAIANGASGAVASSIFVYKGPHKAVLISYPSQIGL